jgi:hypothetical protein
MKLHWSLLIVAALSLVISPLALGDGGTVTLLAQSPADPAGAPLQTLELRVVRPGELTWEAAITMGKTWNVDDPPAFLLGTRPGEGDLVAFRLERGYEVHSGRLTLLPGAYYATLRAGHGTRDAAGDIRPFDVFGTVRVTLNLP